MSTPAKNESADTHDRLLHTALTLYARDGLHSVSLRQIGSEAGCRNSAAVHYHFENKLGVITALVAMITRELNSLAKANAAGAREKRSLRQACRDLLLPLTQLPQQQQWGADAVRFLSRLVSENDADIAAMLNTTYKPFWQRLDRALAKQLPELSPTVRRLRLMFMSTNVFHGVAEVSWLTHTPLGDLSNVHQEELLDHLVNYLIGGLEAPAIAEH